MSHVNTPESDPAPASSRSIGLRVLAALVALAVGITAVVIAVLLVQSVLSA